ncbi:hypothetical protein GOBAR_AA33957 [Gossypium barbadense]|uniref:Uncharacterized protein n=1 Tax=Gossypium barbadense TaxID=3634 RepID=A0A2P5W6M8_GOSBA|nr:hypothetical protein GOBAR_AA33957 [Gossypium barbadense]
MVFLHIVTGASYRYPSSPQLLLFSHRLSSLILPLPHTNPLDPRHNSSPPLSQQANPPLIGCGHSAAAPPFIPDSWSSSGTPRAHHTPFSAPEAHPESFPYPPPPPRCHPPAAGAPPTLYWPHPPLVFFSHTPCPGPPLFISAFSPLIPPSIVPTRATPRHWCPMWPASPSYFCTAAPPTSVLATLPATLPAGPLYPAGILTAPSPTSRRPPPTTVSLPFYRGAILALPHGIFGFLMLPPRIFRCRTRSMPLDLATVGVILHSPGFSAWELTTLFGRLGALALGSGSYTPCPHPPLPATMLATTPPSPSSR